MTMISYKAVENLLKSDENISLAEIGRRLFVSRQAVSLFLQRNPELKCRVNIDKKKELTIELFKIALTKIADLGDNLSRDIAISALEKKV